ncbi:L-2-hydroxyglutarate oxidase LhgO [Candidatus Sulfotelmatomonas gaucii]|uniref:L-2-hydroxyglutarate oxidase LhgO n=1 Tax=Candidatus Sulfuritelmatomonas gaucii TaxID=2043161 RepID=A0A2N9L5T0_9BACT|nr:L-2-hydroxyglutarate oxidase LhgO [Candidatus Sulfotelmatomonas gaucii]
MAVKVAIIGGGIVGLATARQLLERHPGSKVLVLEKESAPGQHQTGHNSGVLHCGLYYTPGSARARLAVTGVRRMVAFCEEHGVPYELCGKTVIATEEEEIPRLHALFERGAANGVEGLKLLTADEIHEYEPHAAGIAGIRVPREGITDYTQVCDAMVKEVREWGGEIQFSSEAKRMERRDRWTIHTTSGDYEADFLITCAGLHCDRVGRKAGSKEPTKIVPFRGEYYLLKPERQFLARNLIYPVPDPKFPFLGVHFTRLIHGGVECGPNAVLAFAREGYRKGDFSLRDTIETLTYRGFWRFFLRYPKMCWDELKRSYSKDLFCLSLQRLVPEIKMDDLAPGGSGVRAQAMPPSGELLQDFYFARSAGALHVLNAPSPAATASLAIADEILNMAGDAITQ